MTPEEMYGRAVRLFTDARALLCAKGRDYSPGSNAFENFAAISTLAEVVAVDVLWVLLSKHLVAIRAQRQHTEPLRQRFLDALNYLAILEAMMSEWPPNDRVPAALCSHEWTPVRRRDGDRFKCTLCGAEVREAPSSERPVLQIKRLADVILQEFGGPTKSEGACDAAITIMRDLRARLAAADQEYQLGLARCTMLTEQVARLLKERDETGTSVTSR